MIKNVEVKTIGIEYADKIAELHFKLFKGFFLTNLGKNFLVQFYKSILTNPLGIGFGAFCESELIGFAIGSRNNSGFYYSIIKQNGIKLGVAAFKNIVLNPLNLKRLIISLCTSSSHEFKEIPILLSICVSSEHESKGVGKKLLYEFESNLKFEGFKELILTTDSQNNELVNQFYQRNNYLKVISFLQGKRKMNLYHKKI